MKVSVIVPCYNAEEHVERCLNSLFAQSHDDLDIICVNDGSTDATVRVLNDLRQRAPRPMMILDQPNGGASKARNTGAEFASGTYLQFMDADDVLLPKKIEAQLSIARDHELPDLIIGSYRILSNDGGELRTTVQESLNRDPWLDLMQHRLGGTPQNLWKRTSVDTAGRWTEGLGSSQEYDLMFKILRNGGRVVYDDQVLTEIHLLESSISHRTPIANWKRFVELRGRIAEHLRSIPSIKDMHPYDQALFDSIRILYAYDAEAAMEMYERLLPPKFKPRPTPTTGKNYVVAHSLLGFRYAERLRGLLGL